MISIPPHHTVGWTLWRLSSASACWSISPNKGGPWCAPYTSPTRHYFTCSTTCTCWPGALVFTTGRPNNWYRSWLRLDTSASPLTTRQISVWLEILYYNVCPGLGFVSTKKCVRNGRDVCCRHNIIIYY